MLHSRKIASTSFNTSYPPICSSNTVSRKVAVSGYDSPSSWAPHCVLASKRRSECVASLFYSSPLFLRTLFDLHPLIHPLLIEVEILVRPCGLGLRLRSLEVNCRPSPRKLCRKHQVGQWAFQTLQRTT